MTLNIPKARARHPVGLVRQPPSIAGLSGRRLPAEPCARTAFPFAPSSRALPRSSLLPRTPPSAHRSRPYVGPCGGTTFVHAPSMVEDAHLYPKCFLRSPTGFPGPAGSCSYYVRALPLARTTGCAYAAACIGLHTLFYNIYSCCFDRQTRDVLSRESKAVAYFLPPQHQHVWS